MGLYIGITAWMFLLLLLGLRTDSVRVADCWPDKPKDNLARNNLRIVSFLTACTFLLFWFLTAFRSSAIGNDTKVYIYYFDIFSRGLDFSRTFEVGYQILNYLLGKVTRDHHAFLIIIATIMYGGIVVYFRKYSKNIAVSLCLFFALFFSPFTSMFRQGIAMVIALYGYQLLKNNKNLLAAVLFLLATTFHTTAMVCFLLFLKTDIMKKKWFVCGLALVFGLISSTGILKSIVNVIAPRYNHYFSSQYASTGWLAVTYSLIIYLIWYFLVSSSIDDAKQDRVVINNFSFLLIFATFGYSVNLFTRAAEYYLLNAVIELPNMMYRGRVKNYRIWLFCICGFLLIMFIVTLYYRPGWNHLYPYEFWS